MYEIHDRSSYTLPTASGHSKRFEAGAIKNGAVEWMEASKMANQPRSLCVGLARPIATASVAASTMSNSDLGLCL